MDNLYYRVKSYLRKRGETNHYNFGVDNSSGEWIITYWYYSNIPQPEVSEVPNLTEEEYFVEYEDINYFTNDVYKVGTDGVIRADRRPCLSGILDNKIVLELGRYCIDMDNDLKLYINGRELKHLVKAITPTQVSVEVPTEETTLVVWRV